MAKLKDYNGHYCESEYENAFLGFLEKPDGRIRQAMPSPVRPDMKCCWKRTSKNF